MDLLKEHDLSLSMLSLLENYVLLSALFPSSFLTVPLLFIPKSWCHLWCPCFHELKQMFHLHALVFARDWIIWFCIFGVDMQWNDSEEMACDEAELGPDEFAGKMHYQQKLQEQVKSSWILVLEVGWRWIQLNGWEFFLQQLEMLKHMRKFHLDDQSAILEKVNACVIHFLIHFSSFCSKIKMQTSGQ